MLSALRPQRGTTLRRDDEDERHERERGEFDDCDVRDSQGAL